ncbi:MAG: BrnA antitoxin family protein [Zoogloeaceae bacterium]|nr:BrnA antitoxin family protein [Zoogloeaceae bacterium]
MAAAFAQLESEIDFSDIPEADDEFWETAVRIGREKPRKLQTTIRLDEDVIAWFKAAGRGYQSRMNAILRAVMFHDMGRKTGRKPT